MADPAKGASPTGAEAFAGRLVDDLLALDKELGEVDLLITQARSEAARHESRRATSADKLAALTKAAGDPAERVELATDVVGLTKRASIMSTQVDVLEGKRRALARYRDAVASYAESFRGLDPESASAALALKAGAAADDASGGAAMPVAVSRLVLSAQEDLRRAIARAMHDGPAQSLTNIVLQAQIVQRLVDRDPASAAAEVRQLIAMVQHTLDATKSFIFDVRPMVLDDLGLVPTLRRGTRERGRRAGIAVGFESMGQDRRLPMDLESGLFRMLDEALAGYLGAGPDRVSLRLDWGDRLEARLTATRAATGLSTSGPGEVSTDPGDDLPPTLAAMMEDRREDGRDAARAAIRGAIVVLPPSAWREIQGRAASTGVTAELLADGGELRLVAEIPPPETEINAAVGQGIVEYGLILALTSVLTVVWLVVFGGPIADALAAIGNAVDAATGG
jgi:two-component system sensor histidine kinase DegS